MSTRVTCTDIETGESASRDIQNDWLLVTDGNRYLDHEQRYANGTVILTIKVKASDE